MTNKQPVPPAKARPVQDKERASAPTTTGLISKVKTLFSSQKEMTRTTPKVKKPVRRK